MLQYSRKQNMVCSKFKAKGTKICIGTLHW